MRRLGLALLITPIVGVMSAAHCVDAADSAVAPTVAGDPSINSAPTEHALTVQVQWFDGQPAEDVAVVIERRSSTGSSSDSTPARTAAQRTDAEGTTTWPLPASHDDAFVADAQLHVRLSYPIDLLTVERAFALQTTHNVIRLPERSPDLQPRRVVVEGFVPSVHGFKFRNRFEGYPIPHSGLDHLKLPVAPRTYGLCGGMSLSVMEHFQGDRPIPAHTERPAKSDALYQYLYRQQRRTLGPRGEMVVKYATWMRLPDTGADGTQHRTTKEIDDICAQLDAGRLVLTGLVLADAENGRAIWRNHQVVTYGYEDVGRDAVRLLIYDPNYPGRDDVSIVVQRVPISSSADLMAERTGVPGALGCSCRMGTREVRGIFMHEQPE